MFLRREKGWELWGSCHPLAVGCIADGREQCHCQYHIVNDDRTQCMGFESWKEAESRFIELTGAKSMLDTIIKH